MSENESQNIIGSPPPKYEVSSEQKKLSDLIDTNKLTPEEVARCEKALADPTPIAEGLYQGRSFRDAVMSDTPITIEKIRNIGQISKSPGYGQMTADGRDFTALSEKDVDGLNDLDYDRYNKWNIARKQEAVVSGTELGKQLDNANLSLDRGITQGKEAVVSLDQSINNKQAKVIEKVEVFNKISESTKKALSFLNPTVSSQITAEAQKTLTDIQSQENSDKKSTDPAIVRVDGKIDEKATLANIQAGIIIGQEKTLTDSITDPAKKESFQKEVEKLRGMNIGGRIDGKEKVISSIQSDPSLPREVATRHEETAKRLLDGATDVQARRYQDGTYIIDSKSKAGEDQTLTLDGQGNVTLTVGGLDYSTRFLDRSVDTSERDNAINNNKTLDKARALTTQKMDVELGTMADLNLYPDIGVEAKKLVPTLIDQGENFRAFQKLVFPQDRERGEALLQTMRSDTEQNGSAISSTKSTPEVTADTNKKDRLTELDKRNTSMMQELQTMENDIVGKYREVPENADSDLDVGITKFETDVKNASEMMTKSGYDLLGQEYLDDLIRGLRSRDHGVGIWKDGAIDMQDDYVREKQLKELDAFGRTMYEGAKQSATEKGEVSTITSSRDALQNIRKSMSNDALRNRWNNSEALGKWVDEKMNPPTKSKDPEKEATGENGK